MSAQRKAPERSCAAGQMAAPAGYPVLHSGTVATPRRQLRAIFCATIATLCCAPCLHAADPQSYKVDIASTGDSTRDDTLKATSDLINLRKTAPVGPFALIGRARGDLDRLKTVLESYGYYQSYVDIKIDGLPLDDPTLGEKLSAKASGDDAVVKITFSLGQLYHLRRIELDGEIPASVKGALGLSAGAPAVAANVLAAGDRLQTALADQGYAFAK